VLPLYRITFASQCTHAKGSISRLSIHNVSQEDINYDDVTDMEVDTPNDEGGGTAAGPKARIAKRKGCPAVEDEANKAARIVSSATSPRSGKGC